MRTTSKSSVAKVLAKWREGQSGRPHGAPPRGANHAPDRARRCYYRGVVDDAEVKRLIASGQLVEVELIVDSKNDYEYLMLEDRKPSGFEPDDQRSGYIFEGLRAYRELRDDRVSFFLSSLARGQHSVSYRLRAETPGQRLAALPAKIEGMYSPELTGNSDEFRLKVIDR